MMAFSSCFILIVLAGSALSIPNGGQNIVQHRDQSHSLNKGYLVSNNEHDEFRCYEPSCLEECVKGNMRNPDIVSRNLIIFISISGKNCV